MGTYYLYKEGLTICFKTTNYILYDESIMNIYYETQVYRTSIEQVQIYDKGVALDRWQYDVICSEEGYNCSHSITNECSENPMEDVFYMTIMEQQLEIIFISRAYQARMFSGPRPNIYRNT